MQHPHLLACSPSLSRHYIWQQVCLIIFRLSPLVEGPFIAEAVCGKQHFWFVVKLLYYI